MIVWGGYGDQPLTAGGAYDPFTNAWSQMAQTDVPGERRYHSAVWTGTQMVVWGGQESQNTGGVYSPGNDVGHYYLYARPE